MKYLLHDQEPPRAITAMGNLPPWAREAIAAAPGASEWTATGPGGYPVKIQAVQTSNAARQARSVARAKAAGLVASTVWIPPSRRPELLALVREWVKEFTAPSNK